MFEELLLLKSNILIIIWTHIHRGKLLLLTVTIFLLQIGQKARNSGCDWFIQLSDNQCPTTAICYWTLPDMILDCCLVITAHFQDYMYAQNRYTVCQNGTIIKNILLPYCISQCNTAYMQLYSVLSKALKLISIAQWNLDRQKLE